VWACGSRSSWHRCPNATDLGRGQPLEHTIRQTRIALRMADLLGIGGDQRVATYYVGLLVSVYCHADAREQAMWLGDDIELKAEVYAADMESLRGLLLTLRRVGAGDAGLARARRILAFPARGWQELSSFLRVHSTLQSQFAERIGLPQELTSALAQSYARWDGKGEPAGVRAEDVPPAGRVVALADLVEVSTERRASKPPARWRSSGPVGNSILLWSDSSVTTHVSCWPGSTRDRRGTR
jgi:HD domain